jgi:hypothetical protein
VILSICDLILQKVSSSILIQKKTSIPKEKEEKLFSNIYDLVSDFYSSKVFEQDGSSVYDMFEGGLFMKKSRTLLQSLVVELSKTREHLTNQDDDGTYITDLRTCYEKVTSMLLFLGSKFEDTDMNIESDDEGSEWIESFVRSCFIGNDYYIHITCVSALYDLIIVKKFISMGEYRIRPRHSRKIFLKVINFTFFIHLLQRPSSCGAI